MNSLVSLEVMMVVDLDTEPRGSPQILRDPQRSRGCDEPLAVTLGPQTHQAPFGNSGFVTTWVVGRKQDRDIESRGPPISGLDASMRETFTPI